MMDWFKKKIQFYRDFDFIPAVIDPKEFNQADFPFQATKISLDKKYLPVLSKNPTTSYGWVGLFARTLTAKFAPTDAQKRAISQEKRNQSTEVSQKHKKTIPLKRQGKPSPPPAQQAGKSIPIPLRVWVTSLSCTQLLFVWDRQIFPPHRMDYEPIFIFKWGKNRILAYDGGHYGITRVNLSPQQTIILKYRPWWRSFSPDPKAKSHFVISADPSIKSKYPVIPVKNLYDVYLEHWWEKPEHGIIPFLSGGKLIIEDRMKDPFLFLTTDEFYNPHPLSLLEELSTKISYPFMLSALISNNLIDSLESMREEYLIKVINQSKRASPTSRKVIGEFLGYCSMVFLLHHHDLIDIIHPEDTFIKQFITMLYDQKGEELKLNADRVITTFKKKKIEKSDLIDFLLFKINTTESTREYFTELKNLILEDSENQQDLINWIRKARFRKNFSKKDREDYSSRIRGEFQSFKSYERG